MRMKEIIIPIIIIIDSTPLHIKFDVRLTMFPSSLQLQQIPFAVASQSSFWTQDKVFYSIV